MNDNKKYAVALPESSARNSAPIVYISFDGMLEPLGHSQVLAYLYRLAESGFRFIIVSLEREQDISAAAVSRLTHQLLEHGIEWRWDLYRQGGIGDVVRNLWTSYKNSRDLCQNRKVDLMHARSFLPACIARMINVFHGTPYLFDLRGCWVEERVAEGRWITNRVSYKVAKLIEQNLVNHAKALVTLTELHAREIMEQRSSSGQSIAVIPTCADYDIFTDQADLDALSPEIVSYLHDKLVIGMVGSISKSYCVQEGFQLFREIQQLRPDAHLLCLTRQTAEMQTLLCEYGVPESSSTLQSVTYEEIPAWMTLIDWALLLLKEGPAKKGSMPTKLAEFFAAEIRIAQYGCNAEVSERVLASGCGIVLKNLSPEELKRAAQQIVSQPVSGQDTARARIATRAYFGVEQGVRKYARLYSDVIREQ